MSSKLISYPSPYYEYRFFMQERYGKSLYKVPLDFEFSCPHRDNDAKGGCTFCSEDGSKATQIKGIHDIKEQIKASMSFAKTRYGATGFTAYVQAYTATFAPLKVFKEKIEAVLEQFPFDSLHLGTRPDCLPNSTLEYLQELSEKVDLWVELGLQTCHNKTLNTIRRGHDWECALKGLDKLKSKGLQVVTHAILGLPEETKDDMLQTAKTFAKLPFDGIKIHNLHIIKNTQMERDHLESPIPMINELEYIDLLSQFIQHLPSDMPIMRINTDTPPHELVAPHWGIQKGQLKKSLIDHMNRLGRRQGDFFSSPLTESSFPKIKIVTTMDGSKSCLSPEHGEPYHPRYGAARHARQKFIDMIPNHLWESCSNTTLEVLDIGFGLGYNSFTLIEQCHLKQQNVHITAIENHYINTKQFIGSHTHDSWNKMLKDLCDGGKSLPHPEIQIDVLWGDARYQSQKCLPKSMDLIMLDAFHEKNNAELASSDFFAWLKHLLKDQGVLLFSRFHQSILNALLNVGFTVAKKSDSNNIYACLNSQNPERLSQNEIQEISDSLKSKPYRDPHLCLPHRDIVRKRELSL